MEKIGRAFLWLWFAFVTMLLTLLGFVLASNHKTLGYSLGSQNNNLVIIKEIDWRMDEDIPLDRTINYSQAVHLLDSLNKTLK